MTKIATLNLITKLSAYSRAPLFSSPSVMETLPRLSDRLGISLWCKRDDLLPIAMGGNKIRQLEYYLGEALAQNADSVLITGAIQSNFVRLCAASARKLGLIPYVQLEKRVPNDDVLYQSSGNVLLNQLFGAKISYYTEEQNEEGADKNLDKLADTLRQQGKSPYVIHLGVDHSPLGGLGYARAATELFDQCQANSQIPDHIVLASGSGLTHAGFLAGTQMINWHVPVHGICVRRPAKEQRPRIIKRTNEICQMLGGKLTVSGTNVHVDDSTLAPGYGQMNAQVKQAIEYAAQDEGLLLDPVYTGRTFAGLISLVEQGLIAKGQSVIFIHTGGLPALFAYQKDIL